jgi:hypothetical protein
MTPQQIIENRMKDAGIHFPKSLAKSIIMQLEKNDYQIVKIHPDDPRHSVKQIKRDGLFDSTTGNLEEPTE